MMEWTADERLWLRNSLNRRVGQRAPLRPYIGQRIEVEAKLRRCNIWLPDTTLWLMEDVMFGALKFRHLWGDMNDADETVELYCDGRFRFEGEVYEYERTDGSVDVSLRDVRMLGKVKGE